MANNFSWDDKNFISEYWLRNYRAVQKIIFDCECVQELKIFFSANQGLYYGHMALVKLKELFVTTDHKKYASDNKLCLEFQTEANFLLFAFLQIVTPYREIIKKSSCFTEDEIRHYFIKNSQADFFGHSAIFKHIALFLFSHGRYIKILQLEQPILTSIQANSLLIISLIMRKAIKININLSKTGDSIFLTKTKKFRYTILKMIF